MKETIIKVKYWFAEFATDWPSVKGSPVGPGPEGTCGLYPGWFINGGSVAPGGSCRLESRWWLAMLHGSTAPRLSTNAPTFVLGNPHNWRPDTPTLHRLGWRLRRPGGVAQIKRGPCNRLWALWEGGGRGCVNTEAPGKAARAQGHARHREIFQTCFNVSKYQLTYRHIVL